MGGGLTPPFLTSAVDMELSGQLHVLALGNSPQYIWKKGWVGPQNKSGPCGIKKNFFPLQRIEL
jgi:hypothetical protein